MEAWSRGRRAAELDAEPTLTAEQQIRAWAVDTAAYHGSDSHHSSPAALVREWCEIADLVGAYIRDGSAP